MAKEKNSIKQEDVAKVKITKMKRLFGFDFEDFSSWDNLVKLMMRPEDPSSLAVFRILFGLVMMIDIPNERGMVQADIEYGDKNLCHFPLFNFLSPLAVEWMVLVYAIMFLGAFGIMIGFKYRFSCLCFVTPYWYLFFLDKTTWNNHSYLYGLIGFQLLLYDANRCYSIDGLLNKSIRNSHVPLWNYCILRIQIIFVYFIAGLKKCDLDWVSGYSMNSLGSHWVFDPFKLFLTTDQVTLIVVHIGGLIIDLFVGFLMFFDKTRILGTLMSGSFHIMNSRMFSIGMFPYTMLATTIIFYSNDWPKRLASKFKKTSADLNESGKFIISKRSPHCIYDSIDEKKDDDKSAKQKKPAAPRKRTFYHKFFTIFTFLYIAEQLFLPYSHFITKGYNNWTNGLYGYSWDMMVHSWHTQHIKIHFIDKKTNKTQYINPKAWTSRRRWSSHADMIYQYAKCIQERLQAHGYEDIELYMDVWRSMNHRFNQRQIDPRVNLLEAKWSPFEQTSWLIPLMTDLSDWRSKMKEIEDQFSHDEYELTFVADLPGLRLENYVTEFLNSSVEVLRGRINLEVEYTEEEEEIVPVEEKEKETRKKKEVKIKKRNYTLNVGDKKEIPSGAYHNIYTISDEPSSFLYIYLNETAIYLSDLYRNFYSNMMWTYNRTMIELEKQRPESVGDAKLRDELVWIAYNQTLLENSKTFQNMISLNRTDPEQDLNATLQSIIRYFTEKKINSTKVYYEFVDHFYKDFDHKTVRASYSKLYKIYRKVRSEVMRFKQSFHMVYLALKSIFTREDFVKLVNLHIYNDTLID